MGKADTEYDEFEGRIAVMVERNPSLLEQDEPTFIAQSIDALVREGMIPETTTAESKGWWMEAIQIQGWALAEGRRPHAKRSWRPCERTGA